MALVHFIIFVGILVLILGVSYAYGQMRKEDRKFWRSAVGRVFWGMIFPPSPTGTWKGPRDLIDLLIDHTVAKTEPDEEVITYASVFGTTVQDKGQELRGILTATIHRLIFAYRNRRDKSVIQLISFPYNVITGLEVRGHAFAPEIRFLAYGKTVELRMTADDLDEMVRIIREGMSGKTPGFTP